jgi:hypothetical protein
MLLIVVVATMSPGNNVIVDHLVKLADVDKSSKTAKETELCCLTSQHPRF